MPTSQYIDFSAFMATRFDGKMQKLTVNAGFSCPNRDGTIGRGGCTYCNNKSFSPAYCQNSDSITDQLIKGKAFFGKKYPSMRYLAYFQSYTNTHGEVSRLLSLYYEALSVDSVDGLIIGTRPDCMPDGLLKRLGEMATDKYIMVEYGAESSHDATLNLINRCHTWQQTADAVRRTASAGIDVGLHLIMGLPGETDEMMLETIDAVNAIPVNIIKIHQLQLIRGTRMAMDVANGAYDIRRFTVDEYIALCCKIISRLRDDIAIERFVSQSPDELLIYPRWGLKNYQFTNLLHSRLKTQQAQEEAHT